MDILVIDNRPFIIDTQKAELRQYNRPSNTISFNAFTAKDGFFLVELDCDDIKIPQSVLQIPEQLSPVTRASINLRARDEEWNFYLGDEPVARRLCGQLPKIDIAGTSFTIDWRLRELRETDQPTNAISFYKMDASEDSKQYLFFYDTQCHTHFNFDEKVTEMPENIVIAEIPNEFTLDPVAVARETCRDETGFLAEHPITPSLSAVIKPITNIGLEKFVEENKQRPIHQLKR